MIDFARVLRNLVVIAALIVPAFAQAEDWPARPVTIIVPFAAGGTTDIVGRIIAQSLSERLNQRFIVQNTGGAGGNLGATTASKAISPTTSSAISSRSPSWRRFRIS